MFALFNTKQVADQLNEAANKNPNSLSALEIGLIAVGIAAIGACAIWLYKKISDNNTQLRSRIDRTQNEIKTMQSDIEEIKEGNGEVRQSMVHLHQEVQVAQRQLDQLQQQTSETQRLLDGHEKSSYSIS